MATRSAIGMMNPDGKIRAVYCHWDGYLDHVGKILNEHYRNSDKIVSLLDQGDISSLEKDISECTFYGRDRDETEVDALLYDSEQDFVSEYKNAVDYLYVYRQGQWFVSEGSEFVSVDNALKEIENV